MSCETPEKKKNRRTARNLLPLLLLALAVPAVFFAAAGGGNSDPVPSHMPMVTISRTGGDTIAFMASSDDARLIGTFVSHAEWREVMSNCLPDVDLRIDDVSYKYHSDCGTLIDEENCRCCTLAEADRDLLNTALSSYITLGS